VIGLALFNRLRFPAAFPVDIDNLRLSRALGNLAVYMHNKNSFIFAFNGGYTLVMLPRIVTPYRDSVNGTSDRVTYQN
jgi:hypothetical protein